MYQSELKELSKISGGKNMRRIPRGSMDDIYSIDLPMMPKSGEKYPKLMLMRKRVGV